MKDISRSVSALIGPVISVVAASLCLLALEIAARVWVGMKWTDEEITTITEPVTARGGYIGDPVTGYRLESGFSRVDALERRFTHNAAGFRHRTELAADPDSVYRVLTIGASTVYGVFVDDDSTASVGLEARLSEAYPEVPIEVVNLGVPGWTSRETVRRVQDLMKALRPNVVIMVDGRNELFPELFDGFQPDYSHYRNFAWRSEDANLRWKRLFRVSHLAMLLIHRDGGDGMLGYSLINEDLVYGSIRFENQPTRLGQVRERIEDPARWGTWRDNVVSLLDAAGSVGAHTVLVEMPFRKEGFASGVMPVNRFEPEDEDELRSLLERGVAANNAILRELAARAGVSFVETDHLVDQAYLIDDCHFNALGEAELARTLAEHLMVELPEYLLPGGAG